MELPRNCSNCDHFDGDCFCALPTAAKVILGAIQHPAMVTCALWVKKDAPDEPETGTTPKDHSAA